MYVDRLLNIGRMVSSGGHNDCRCLFDWGACEFASND
jgi:hypothetical protein